MPAHPTSAPRADDPVEAVDDPTVDSVDHAGDPPGDHAGDAAARGPGRIGAPTREEWWSSPWLARGLGALLGLLVLGPALAPGALFSLDLILPESIPVPRGAWGLGPELPRRVPLMLPFAWLSPVMSAPMLMKTAVVVAIAAGFVGVYRIVEPTSRWAAIGAATFFAANPFLLTRIAAGHLMIVFAMAMLPWCYPVLLRPGRSIPRTLLWCAALGFTGNYGGLIAAILVGIGLLVDRPRRWIAVPLAWLVGQLPWFVPGLVVFEQGAQLAVSATFATQTDGALGWPAVLAGHGFWQDTYQVGDPGSVEAGVIGAVLLGLALLGHRHLPSAWRRSAGVLAALGAIVVYGSAVPGVREALNAFAGTSFGASLRESQRLYPLVAMWLAPAAGLGAADAARRLRAMTRPDGGSSVVGGAAAAVYVLLPLCAASVVCGPGLLGVEGHLVPVAMPAEWEQARTTIQQSPGTTVVFPWYGYTNVDLGGKHHVLNPWPIYLGGDVIVASDLRTNRDTATPERIDPREALVTTVANAIVDDKAPPSARLAELGVRWVVFHREGQISAYGSVLDADPGLERVQGTLYVHVYRVRGWRGAAVDARGVPVAIDPVIEPFARVDSADELTWYRPYASGWLRGFTPVDATADGVILAPAGAGYLWYWPSLLVVLGDAMWVVGIGWSIRAARSTSEP